MARRSEEELLLPQQRESEGATTVGYIVIAVLAFVLLIVGVASGKCRFTTLRKLQY